MKKFYTSVCLYLSIFILIHIGFVSEFSNAKAGSFYFSSTSKLRAGDYNISLEKKKLSGSTFLAFSGTWGPVTYSSSGITPTSRHENGFVEVNGKFYLVGGRTVRNVNIFDPVSRIWSLGAASPVEMHHYQAVAYNNEIYAIAAMTGSYPNEKPLANIYIYNPQTNTWRTGAAIPSSRRRGSAGVVVYNSKFYIVGGIQNGHIDGWVPWVDEYNPATGSWTILPNAPVARDHFMATLINGKIYAAGGRQTHYPDFSANTIARVDVYDIATRIWTTPTQLPTPRGAPGVAYINGELIIAGGEVSGSSTALKTVEGYNPVTNTWQVKPSLDVGRHATQMISYQQKLYLCAGATSRGGNGQTNTMSVADYADAGNSQQLISFTLINASTEREIQTISSNATLNLATLPSQSLNIRANTSPAIVGSVKFALSGTQTRNQTETGAPYALFGDVNGNYNAWTPAVGSYTLKATPYSAASGGGTAGTPLTINFTVVNQNQANQPPVITKPANVSVVAGQSFNYQVLASDPEGGVLSYQASNLPGGLAINSTSGLISGTVGLPTGSYTVSLTVKDQAGLTASTSFVITVTSSSTSQQVISFTLINASNEQVIQNISSNATLNLANLPSRSLNIRANTNPATVGSVVFALSGQQTYNRTETGAPYALFGDVSGNYNAWTPAIGSYTLKATPYSSSGGSGTAGTPLTINFNVVNQANVVSMATMLSDGFSLNDDLQVIENNLISDSIAVYPNPVHSYLNVRLNGYHQDEWSFTLYNTLGLAVQLPKVNLAKELKILTFDLRPYNLPPGLYYLRMMSNLNGSKVVTLIHY